MRNHLLVLLCCLCAGLSWGQEKVVAEVKLQGNKRTKAAFLYKIIQLQAGKALDTVVVAEDIYRLKRLPSVSHAYVQYHPTGVANKVRVVYGIEENFTLIPFASVYTTNREEFAYRIGLQEFNVLGRNITLGGFYQRDIFDSYGAHLRAPNIFGRKWGIALSYQDLTTEEPVFLQEGMADYRYNNESMEVLGLYQLNFKNRFEFGVNLFTEDYQYLAGATAPEVPQDLRVNKHLIKLLYNYDTSSRECTICYLPL